MPVPAAPPRAPSGPGTPPVHTLTQRLAACGLSVHTSRWRDQEELVISNVSGGRSCLTLTGNRHACWHYEPSIGPATSATALAAIIVRILGAPRSTGSTRGVDAYRAFPLKAAVGRYLQDRGLTVTLRISEDLESFEATTDIEVANPVRPWLGTVRLADNGDLDWECDCRVAFDGDLARLAGVIAPILRTGPGTHRRGNVNSGR